MSQIQANGLSPRATKHRRAHSATINEEFCGGSSSPKNSITPTPSTQHGRFFNDPVPSSRPSYSAASMLPSVASTPSASTTTPTASSCKGHPKQQPMKQATAFRLIAMAATALAVVLCTRAVAASPNPTTSLRASAASAEVQDRCAKRIESRRGLRMQGDRKQCAAVLPTPVVEREPLSWLVSVHVDRAPLTEPATRLRGAAPLHRSLPHQYYVRAMEAALHSIAVVEPGASVDVAIFSESQWVRGGMVDEMGVPLDWDVPGDICEELGLHCTQSLVLLNEETSLMADSLECIAASDVLVASEGKFSRAAAVLSNHVKVLTDRWEVDEDEMMVVLNPATTIAGMPASQRKLLRTLVADYHECSPSSA